MLDITVVSLQKVPLDSVALGFNEFMVGRVCLYRFIE